MRLTSLCISTALGLLLASVVASASPLRLHLPDTTVTVDAMTVKHHATPYLKLNDLEAALPVTVKRTGDAALLTLCSTWNCLPVFVGDEDDAAVKAGVGYLSGRLVARVLGCEMKVAKSEVSFSCPARLPHARPGSDVGSMAPGFRLRSSDTDSVGLSDLLKKGPVVVIFVRSGEWDPFSQAVLKSAQARLDTIRAAGFQVVAIHGYQARVGAKWAKTLGLTFPQLADTFSAVMRGYDVFDQGHLPHPAIFVIDASGVIRYQHVFEDLNQPPDMDAVWKEILKPR
jgi:peroxiredoxin